MTNAHLTSLNSCSHFIFNQIISQEYYIFGCTQYIKFKQKSKALFKVLYLVTNDYNRMNSGTWRHRSSFLEPINVTLFGERVLAQVIKNVVMESLSFVIWVGPKCHHRRSSERQAHRECIQEEKAVCPGRQSLEWWGHKARNAGSHRKLDETRNELSPRTLKGRTSLPSLDFHSRILISAFYYSRNLRESISVVLRH